jgi:hypothetical protein
MVKGSKSSKMVHSTKVISKMGKSTVKGLCDSKTDLPTLGIFRMDYHMVME